MRASHRNRGHRDAARKTVARVRLDGCACVGCDGAMHTPTSARFPTIAGLLLILLLAPACQSPPTPAPTPSPADAAAEAEVRQVIDGVYAWVSGPQGPPKDR